jgi:DNA-binding transcriptional LysR family regulator
MELRHLRYFVAVAEELHFRRAAERLHIAQPALSGQVRKLEDQLGVRLLDRGERSVSLTPAGAALLTEARRLLRDAEVAHLAARNASGRPKGRLRIGYMPSSLPARIPRALRRLTTDMSNLEASLEPGNGIELLQAVEAERLDAAIVSLPAPTIGLRTTHLGREHAVAAFPIGHRHAVASAIRLDQVAPERIVVFPREANRAFYDAVVTACRQAGLSPTLVETADGHVESALLAVASGHGIALLPESAAERHLAPGVRFVPFAAPCPEVATAVVTRRDTTHLPTAAFLRAVSQTDQATHTGATEDTAPSGRMTTVGVG